jgi:predicted GNAT family N-acyltransferase
MPRVRPADFVIDHAAIRRVRFAVFVAEQGVPEEIELDDRDPACVHVLAFENAEPVGTGRVDLDAAGKIGRVAVLATARGRGVGTELMQQLHAIARDRGLPSVWCHAQVTAVPFYARLGYRASGERFAEAGIPHVRMELDLRAMPLDASSRP